MDNKKLEKNFIKLLNEDKTYCLKGDKIIKFSKCKIPKCERIKKCIKKNNKIYNKIVNQKKKLIKI